MRKLLTTLLIVVMMLFIPTTTFAFADELTTINEYYQVNADDVYFCDILNSEPKELFTLPNTYFVLKDTSREVVTLNKFGTTLEFIPIKYKGFDGYISKSDATAKLTSATQEQNNKLTEANAYLNKNITLNAKYESAKTGVLEQGKSLIYMGNNKDNVVVLLNNNLAEIPNTYFDKITYDSHSFPEDNIVDMVVDGEVENPYNTLNTTILIVGLTLSSIIILAVIFFPKKKEQSREDRYYEDDYYENYRNKYDTKNH